MPTPMNRRRFIASTSAVTSAIALPALAQAPDRYPTRPITLVVPFPPGGGVDATARILASRLTAAWRQQRYVKATNTGAGEPPHTAFAAGDASTNPNCDHRLQKRCPTPKREAGLGSSCIQPDPKP